MNVYRYVGNNPVNLSDPDGMTAAMSYGAIAATISSRAAVGAVRVGAMALSRSAAIRVMQTSRSVFQGIGAKTACNFWQVADALGAAADNTGVVEMVLCGVKRGFRKRKPNKRRCGNGGNGKPGKSFVAGTLISTREGMKAIEDIKVGDEVATVDELTGKKVWRKVVERYSRETKSFLKITVRNSKGGQSVLGITSEHPVHIEAWDGQPRGDLLADLKGMGAAKEHTLFPSEESTQFGDWVKAGALKIGDRVSTLESIMKAGPTLESAFRAKVTNDNGSMAIASVETVSNPTRVYNLSISSRSGEITHNYLVGDDGIWVHNINWRGAACAILMACAPDPTPGVGGGDFTDLASCRTSPIKGPKVPGPKFEPRSRPAPPKINPPKYKPYGPKPNPYNPY